MQPFNLREFCKTRPLSWSAISSFEYNPEEWYKRYILGEKTLETREMIFGKVFANSIENGRPLAPVTIIHAKKGIIKGKNVEHEFRVTFNGINLIGFADTFDHIKHKQLGEFKTSKNPWTQDKVDQHGQIEMYLLLNYITYKVSPEKVSVYLESIQTEETGDYKIKFKQPIKIDHFVTHRTLTDIIRFGARINKVAEEMEAYVNSQKLSTPHALPNK